MPIGSDVAKSYDIWAAVYDADKNATRDLDAIVVRRAPLNFEGRDVLELGSLLFVARRVDVRQVVGYHVQVYLLGQHSCARSAQ